MWFFDRTAPTSSIEKPACMKNTIAPLAHDESNRQKFVHAQKIIKRQYVPLGLCETLLMCGEAGLRLLSKPACTRQGCQERQHRVCAPLPR